mgnify:FL=1
MASGTQSGTSLLNQPTDLTPIPSLGRGILLAGLDVYNAMLYTLLITVPGTRPFFPSYGIGVSGWLFAPLNYHSFSNYEQTIISQVAQWIPQITLSNVIINFNTSTQAMEIDISYVVNIQGLVLYGNFSNVFVKVT